MVLTNRIQGIKNWAAKVGEVGRYSPEKQAQIEKLTQEYRDKQFERTFSPKENEAFLNDPRMVEIERKSYAEKGLVKIADIPSEALDGVWGKKAIATVEDFKGMKIRTSGLITTRSRSRRKMRGFGLPV